MKKLIALAILLTGTMAQADLVSDFKTMSNNRKGPFTVNWLQYVNGRAGVGGSPTDGCISGGSAGGRFQFQAAFPNSSAQKLAAQDFYVGNLFTTNYYMLMGEYVYGKPCASHDDDQRGLVSQGVKAMPKAASMARHWILEKHFVHKFPAAPLYKAFRIRGIADTAGEALYAQYFINFYLTAMNFETQFLPIYLLAKESPIGTSGQIDRAREIIATSYDFFKVRFCGSLEVACNDPRVTRLYQLRNAVHNQLSLEIVNEIDRYLKDNPWYVREHNTYLQEIQKILREYYSFTPMKIAEQATKAGLGNVKAIADQVTASGPTPQALLALSQAGADLRSNLAQVPYEKKAYALVTIAVISQYVNKEVNKMKTIPSKDVLQALLNTVYMEGFLIKDNWVYFSQEMNGAADLKAAGAQLADFAEIAQATLDQAFQPALKQWILIEPKMQNFIDDTIKSSSLNTVSITAQKLK